MDAANSICGSRRFRCYLMIWQGLNSKHTDTLTRRKTKGTRDGDKQKYRPAGKEAGQIDEIDPESNTEGRQINRQLDRQSRRGCAAGWASWLTHCPAARLQQGDFGLSLDCAWSNACVIVHIGLYSWIVLFIQIECTHVEVRPEEMGRGRKAWTVTSWCLIS